MFPTKIDVDSMFTCQAALHPWFRVFHLCERTLKFMDVGITASFGTVFPRNVVTHTSVRHESDDVSVFATKCPTDQKSGLFVVVDFATNKNSFQKSNQIAGWYVPVCSSSGVVFYLFHRHPSPHHSLRRSSESLLHVSLCNWVIKDDFNTAPSCVLNHDV